MFLGARSTGFESITWNVVLDTICSSSRFLYLDSYLIKLIYTHTE